MANRQRSPGVHVKPSFRDYDGPVDGLLGHVSFRSSLRPPANRNRHWAGVICHQCQVLLVSISPILLAFSLKTEIRVQL